MTCQATTEVLHSDLCALPRGSSTGPSGWTHEHTRAAATASAHCFKAILKLMNVIQDGTLPTWKRCLKQHSSASRSRGAVSGTCRALGLAPPSWILCQEGIRCWDGMSAAPSCCGSLGRQYLHGCSPPPVDLQIAQATACVCRAGRLPAFHVAEWDKTGCWLSWARYFLKLQNFRALFTIDSETLSIVPRRTGHFMRCKKLRKWLC
jgi:hypothetical protein